MLADLGATLENAARLGSQAGLLLQALEHRAALANLELEEARKHASVVVVVGAMSLLLLLLVGTTLGLIVAAAFWDTPHRVLALVLFGAGELLLAGAAAWYVRHRWRCWRLLEHTRDQLTKDLSCLREILRRNP